MSNPSCLECGAIPETVKVGPTGHAKYFVLCQAEVHRRRTDEPTKLTEYGKILSNGHDAPGPAESDWAESRRRQLEFGRNLNA